MRSYADLWVLLAVSCLILTGCERRDAKLRSSNVKARIEGVQEIMGDPEAREHLPALLECLENDSNSLVLREKVIMALSQAGSAGTDTLLKGCVHENPKVRSGAIRSLGLPNPMLERRFTPVDDRRAFPVVSRAVKDQEPEVRTAAVETLGYVSIGSNQIILALPVLISALSDRSFSVRFKAAAAIGRMARETADKPSFAATVQPLATRLTDVNASVREEAAWALGQLGAEASPALRDLVNTLLADANDSVRGAASDSLVSIGRRTASVHSLLTQSLSNTDSQQSRLQILHTLRKSGSLPRSIIPVLTEIINNDTPRLQSLAAMVLADMGKRADAAAPTLRTAFKSRPLRVQISIAWALYNIKGERELFVSTAVAALKTNDRDACKHALDMLGSLNPPAKEATPALASILRNDADETLKQAAEIELHRVSCNDAK